MPQILSPEKPKSYILERIWSILAILGPNAMATIKFTVTEEAEAYLLWYARNIIFEDTASLAARHMMMTRLEQVRHQRRPQEPAPEDLKPVPPAESTSEKKNV